MTRRRSLFSVAQATVLLERATKSGDCLRALSARDELKLVAPDTDWRGSGADGVSREQDRANEADFNFLQMCVRSPRVGYDPESGESRERWKANRENQPWRKMGLEGVPAKRRRRNRK